MRREHLEAVRTIMEMNVERKRMNSNEECDMRTAGIVHGRYEKS